MSWSTVGIIFLTAVLTWIGHAVLTNQQRKLDVMIALEQRKRELYAKFLNLFFDTLKQGGKVDQDKLSSELMDIAKDMTVYASDEVLRLFVQFRSMAVTAERDPKKILEWFGKIILQIRKDLGYSITKIEPRDVLSVFVTDIDKLYP